MDMLIMPYLDFAEAWPSFIRTLALQLTTGNTVFNANRCQCWKASVQLPEWKTPPNGASHEIAQLANTSFAVCTDQFRMRQSFQRVCDTSKVSKQANLTACCHQEKVCLSLSPLPPEPADHVLCNKSPYAAGASGVFLWADLITNTTGM